MQNASTLNIEDFIRDVENCPAIWNRCFSGSKSLLNSTWSELAEKHNLPINILKAKWKGLRDNFRVEYKRIPRDDNGDLLMEVHEFQSKWLYYRSLLYLADHMRSRQPKYSILQNPPYDNPYFLELQKRAYEMNPNYRLNMIQIPDDETNQHRTINLTTSTSSSSSPSPSPSSATTATTTKTTVTSPIQIASGAAAIYAQPILNDHHDYDSSKLRETQRKKIRLNSYNPKMDTMNESNKSQNDNNEPDQSSSSSTYPIQRHHSLNVDGNGDLERSIDDDHHFLLSLYPYMTKLKSSQKLKVRMKIQKCIFTELYKNDGDQSDVDSLID